MNRKKTHVIAVTGGKGGIGKTNISVNLSYSLGKMGKSVLLFDADLGLSNVDVLLGIRTKNNIYDVISGKIDINQILIEGPQGIQILPASSGLHEVMDFNSFNCSGLINAFDDITTDYDYMIIDTAAGISDIVINFVSASDEVIVVLCNEPTSMTDAYAIIKILNTEFKLYKFKILANMVRDIKEGLNLFKKFVKVSDKFLDISMQFLGIIPLDESVRRSIYHQKCVCDMFPNSKSTRAFQELSQKVLTWPAPKIGSGRTEFFSRNLQIENIRA